jgi:predicted ester cyclase
MRTYQRLIAMIAVGAMILTIGIMTGCQQKPLVSDTEARLILDRYLEMVNETKPELASQVLDSGFVLMSPILPGPLEGIQAFKEFIEQNSIAFPDYDVMLKDYMVEGERIWFLFTMSGTNTGPLEETQPTGRKFNITGVGIAEVANGKLKQVEMFWNSVSFFEQLGFTLVPPQVGTE